MYVPPALVDLDLPHVDRSIIAKKRTKVSRLDGMNRIIKVSNQIYYVASYVASRSM